MHSKVVVYLSSFAFGRLPPSVPPELTFLNPTAQLLPISSLITALPGLNSERVPSCEDNSVCKHLFILSGVGPRPAPDNSLHVI